LDDLKYQYEDLIKTFGLKEDENNFLQKDLMAWKDIMDKATDEISMLKRLVGELEEKNRKLNHKLNEVIYNKADAYKKKTLNLLKLGDSPERRQAA
jgi:hypothetical protein